jgi:hypothetical protein
MSRVRFDQSKNTQKIIPRNYYDKWWKPERVPFKQLLMKRHDLNSLSSEELGELMAYREELVAAKTGQPEAQLKNLTAQRDAESLRQVEALLEANPDMNSDSIAKLYRLQRLLMDRLQS